MPRTTDPDVIAALQSPIIRPALLVDVAFGPANAQQHLALSTAGGDWIGGYHGVGSMLSVSTVEEGLTVEARGTQIKLSGLSPQVLTLVNEYAQALLPVRVYFALLSETGSIIWQTPVFFGRTDQPCVTIDGTQGTAEMACENQLIELNTSVERRYTNEDQQIQHPGDGAFKFVDSIQEVSIYWGKTPSSKNNR